MLARDQGAVMFLFEGDFGRILHTGDFRCEVQTVGGTARVLMRCVNAYVAASECEATAVFVPGGS